MQMQMLYNAVPYFHVISLSSAVILVAKTFDDLNYASAYYWAGNLKHCMYMFKSWRLETQAILISDVK